jgi:hypothetical protein
MVDACMRWRHVQIPLLCCSKMRSSHFFADGTRTNPAVFLLIKADDLFCPGVPPFTESVVADGVLLWNISISAAGGDCL